MELRLDDSLSSSHGCGQITEGTARNQTPTLNVVPLFETGQSKTDNYATKHDEHN